MDEHLAASGALCAFPAFASRDASPRSNYLLAPLVAVTLPQERPWLGTDVDPTMLKFVLSIPENERRIQQTTALLDADISRRRFNCERAEQVFLFLIDSVVARYVGQWGLDGHHVVSRPARLWSAKQMAADYVNSRGDIRDQRPSRRGVLALLLGK